MGWWGDVISVCDDMCDRDGRRALIRIVQAINAEEKNHRVAPVSLKQFISLYKLACAV